MKSSSAARSSAAASFRDFLLPAVDSDFDPLLAGGVDCVSLASDEFASADGAGVSLPTPPGVFATAGAAAATAGDGGDGDDADVAAVAAGASIFLAGGGVFPAATAAGAAFLVEAAGGAGAVSLSSLSGTAAFVAAGAVDGAGTATAGGGAADVAGAGLAEDEEPVVEVDAGDGGGEVTPPLPDEDNFLAGGASDAAPVVAADAACESSRASLTRFWDCWYLNRGPRTVRVTCRTQNGGRGK